MTPSPTFRAWLLQQKTTDKYGRYTASGRFISTALDDMTLPHDPPSWTYLKAYLLNNCINHEELCAAKRVWGRYQDYLKRHEAAHE